jgi:hypothetical protein
LKGALRCRWFNLSAKPTRQRTCVQTQTVSALYSLYLYSYATWQIIHKTTRRTRRTHNRHAAAARVSRRPLKHTTLAVLLYSFFYYYATFQIIHKTTRRTRRTHNRHAAAARVSRRNTQHSPGARTAAFFPGGYAPRPPWLALRARF